LIEEEERQKEIARRRSEAEAKGSSFTQFNKDLDLPLHIRDIEIEM
jgi:hypothetical protein